MSSAALHPFEQWNYDAVPRRTWTWNGVGASLERFGLIGWNWFNYSPAYYCIEVVEQTFEAFLAEGPPPKFDQRPPPHIVQEMREHLLARRPGRSTYLTLCVPPERDDERTLFMDWKVDGAYAGYQDLHGPGWGTNVIGTQTPSPFSLLLEPGHHLLHLELRVSANKSPWGSFKTTGEYAFDIERGQHLALEVGCAIDFKKATASVRVSNTA